jgi:hypothetical protein
MLDPICPMRIERFGMTLGAGSAAKFKAFVPPPVIVSYQYSRAENIKRRKHKIYDEKLERQIKGYLDLEKNMTISGLLMASNLSKMSRKKLRGK